VTSLTKKTLPSRDWQTPAAPGQEAFLTPYLTTVRAGTRGNSGFKSVKKYRILSRKRWKALQITTKNLVQAFGSRMPQVRILSLGPTFLEKPPFWAVFLLFGSVFAALAIAVSWWFKGQKSDGRMSERSGWNSQIPNPSQTTLAIDFFMLQCYNI